MKKSSFLLAVLIISCVASMSFSASLFFRDDMSPEVDDYHWSDATPWYLINDVGQPAAGHAPLATDNVYLYSGREVVVNSNGYCNLLFQGYWGQSATMTLAAGDYTLKSTSYFQGANSGTENVVNQYGGNFNTLGFRVGFAATGTAPNNYPDTKMTYNMMGGTIKATAAIVLGNSGNATTRATEVIFNHSAGTMTTNALSIGKVNTTGIYNLTGGAINGIVYGGNLYVGYAGTVKAELNMGNATSTGTISGSDTASLYVGKDNASVNGWGTIAMGGNTSAGRLQNEGTIKADGFGTDRTLDVSQFFWVVSPTDNVGTNGYYAVNHGKLLLPDVAVAAGTGSYNWGEDAADTTIDLVNSLRVGFVNASAGSLDVALLAKDRTDVVAYDGKTFIGIWSIAQMTFDSADITFRYDSALAAALGLEEGLLTVYKLEGTNWVALASTVDSVNNHITANVDEFSVFAVGVPEPATIAILGLGLSLIRRKRN